MVLSLALAFIGSVVTVLLASAAVVVRALTPIAGTVAAAFGIVIVVFAGVAFLSLLILFVVGSTLATRYRFAEKRERQVQEGKRGERGVSNVVAHIVLPTGLAVAGGWNPSLVSPPTVAVLYTSALAFGASDTLASEFGVLAGHARSILTLRPVPPGTNGGVSGRGELAAILGAASTAAIGLGLFVVTGVRLPSDYLLIGAATLSGFVACQVDSVLGEVLENRGYLTKHGTNFLGMLSAIAIAAAVLAAAGALG